MHTAKSSTRLATLERQLQRYCATQLPPSATERQRKRRETLRRHVIRQNLRQQRCLLRQGTEVGWTWVQLTEDDAARAEALVAAMMAVERITRIRYVDTAGETLWEEPMIFRRLWAVGQSLIHDRVAYQVVARTVEGSVQQVRLVPCRICADCGGIWHKRTPPDDCQCR